MTNGEWLLVIEVDVALQCDEDRYAYVSLSVA